MLTIQDQIVRLRDEQGLSWKSIGEKFNLSDEAARSRYRRQKRKQEKEQASKIQPESTRVVIEGITPDDYEPDIREAWSAVLKHQERKWTLETRRRGGQRIEIDPPCAIVLASDLHLGGPGTDYKAIVADAEIIKSTPDMFVIFLGDGVDNWIVSKLAHKQRQQIVDFKSEWGLFASWLEMITDSLLCVVSGNHENWTTGLAGIDRLAHILQGVRVLYHQHEVLFDLIVGSAKYRVKVRHAWKGTSIFNPTHGIDVGWERGGYAFDIGIGGHTHIATLYRQNVKHGKILHALLIGTYKTYDDFGEQIGLAPPVGQGSAALVFNREGDMVFHSRLSSAASYLEFLRNR